MPLPGPMAHFVLIPPAVGRPRRRARPRGGSSTKVIETHREGTMTRRPLFVVLLTLLAVVAVACGPGRPADGGGAPADSPGGTPAPAGGDIFAFGFSYENGDTIAKARVDVFTEANPDVNVEFSESGFEAQPFLAALQSGDPPDV